MTVSDPVDQAPATVDPLRFRGAVSRFATGIAVVSCRDEDGQPHGMTINSFTSISLDPATVLVSIKPGKTHRLISRRGWYGVSILNQEQEGFSAHFAGRPHPTLVPAFIDRGWVPTLRDSLAWFECEVTNRIQVHDHTLFVARVIACDSIEGTPLMFYASRHHRPGLAL